MKLTPGNRHSLELHGTHFYAFLHELNAGGQCQGERPVLSAENRGPRGDPQLGHHGHCTQDVALLVDIRAIYSGLFT